MRLKLFCLCLIICILCLGRRKDELSPAHLVRRAIAVCEDGRSLWSANHRRPHLLSFNACVLNQLQSLLAVSSP